MGLKESSISPSCASITSNMYVIPQIYASCLTVIPSPLYSKQTVPVLKHSHPQNITAAVKSAIKLIASCPSNILGKMLISLADFILLLCLFLVHYSTRLFTVHINSAICCMLLHSKVTRKAVYAIFYWFDSEITCCNSGYCCD